MEDQFNIRIVHDTQMNTQSWVMSDKVIRDSDFISLRKGFYDYLGISIYECPVFVYCGNANSTINSTGRITQETSFVHPLYFEAPVDTFLVNSKFIDILEGDSFFEKISNLSPLLDESLSDIMKQMFWHLHLESGLHCIATIGDNPDVSQ